MQPKLICASLKNSLSNFGVPRHSQLWIFRSARRDRSFLRFEALSWQCRGRPGRPGHDLCPCCAGAGHSGGHFWCDDGAHSTSQFYDYDYNQRRWGEHLRKWAWAGPNINKNHVVAVQLCNCAFEETQSTQALHHSALRSLRCAGLSLSLRGDGDSVDFPQLRALISSSHHISSYLNFLCFWWSALSSPCDQVTWRTSPEDSCLHTMHQFIHRAQQLRSPTYRREFSGQCHRCPQRPIMFRNVPKRQRVMCHDMSWHVMTCHDMSWRVIHGGNNGKRGRFLRDFFCETWFLVSAILNSEQEQLNSSEHLKEKSKKAFEQSLAALLGLRGHGHGLAVIHTHTQDATPSLTPVSIQDM